MLSPRGRRLLAGASPLAGALADPRRRFLAADGLIDPARVEAGRLLLERHLLPHLARIDRPIPPEATWEMTENYGELLPKTARVSTATFERRRGAAWEAAEKTGLAAMLGSASFRSFAEALAGRPLARRWGIQALCYGPGDYAGPHNDHHPEEPEARQGYVDIHLTLDEPGGRPAIPGLCGLRPFQPRRDGRALRPHHRLSPAALALHHAPGRQARPRGRGAKVGAAGDVSLSVGERALRLLSPRPPTGGRGPG